MIETARWLIVFVASVTAIGGLLVDYFIPASGRQHIKNPRWPPHAKFHNAQGILMGLYLGVLAIAILFLHQPLSMNGLVMAAILSSLYWVGIFGARIFPGTAWGRSRVRFSGTARHGDASSIVYWIGPGGGTCRRSDLGFPLNAFYLSMTTAEGRGGAARYSARDRRSEFTDVHQAGALVFQQALRGCF